MNGEGPPARYLPLHLAGALRQALVGVSDVHTRAEVVTLVEETYANGYGDGYARGYPDGAADRDASALTTADMLLSHSELQVRVTAP